MIVIVWLRTAPEGSLPGQLIQKRAFVADPRTGVSATAVGPVVVALRVAAVVAIDFDAVVLGRVAVVAHEEDDRVLTQSGLVELLQDLADVLVSGRDKSSVGSARLFQALVHLEMPLESLLGVVRNVEGGVEEKRLFVSVLCLIVQEAERSADHQVGEERVGMKDLGRAFEQVVKAVPVQEKVSVVVDETVADAEELIEALALWTDVFVGSQMPFAVERRLVAGIAESFGECDFLKGHERALGGHVPLAPRIHAAPLRMPPGHQSSPRRTADGVSVGGCKSHAVSGETVDVRSVQIARPVAPGIERALIVGEEDDDIRLVGRSGDGPCKDGRCEEEEEKDEAKHRRLREVGMSLVYIVTGFCRTNCRFQTITASTRPRKTALAQGHRQQTPCFDGTACIVGESF